MSCCRYPSVMDVVVASSFHIKCGHHPFVKARQLDGRRQERVTLISSSGFHLPQNRETYTIMLVIEAVQCCQQWLMAHPSC